MLSNPKWSPPSKTDFIQWLETKDPKETYNFQDSCGACLLGQYMAAKGQAWDMSVYTQWGNTLFGSSYNIVLSVIPWTMGAALQRSLNVAPGDHPTVITMEEAYEIYCG